MTEGGLEFLLPRPPHACTCLGEERIIIAMRQNYPENFQKCPMLRKTRIVRTLYLVWQRYPLLCHPQKTCQLERGLYMIKTCVAVASNLLIGGLPRSLWCYVLE